MAAITIRNLSDETHRALKARAADHHRSTEAEVRAILDAAVDAEPQVRLGSLLADIGHVAGGVELQLDRDPTPHEPPSLS
ncbi:antitoxin [Propionicimonas sp.]|uniref:FitA-like ribbon-helix-helix domain-containing protein n=1 Tax=Propionicimonas sp. TaxID=1955623 RepID=UPI00184E6F47|nr:antitoxin [Propionicimonas sp.]MBU3975919.1 plasmid stability protein [Actinomycetota bacterium]MBA3020735.1 plasmid stability protein [Propionicimonas sp.]MBU3985109.1 plasmid stability protein [Actinomycetota bacterium]MBU4008099.1 plasmid stability protein [Actinomycetota bacterium]MBU4064687.1 plasmid stability protein [Actinomycetota bacterium]